MVNTGTLISAKGPKAKRGINIIISNLRNIFN